jgi:hypothetical protein
VRIFAVAATLAQATKFWQPPCKTATFSSPPTAGPPPPPSLFRHRIGYPQEWLIWICPLPKLIPQVRKVGSPTVRMRVEMWVSPEPVNSVSTVTRSAVVILQPRARCRALRRAARGGCPHRGNRRGNPPRIRLRGTCGSEPGPDRRDRDGEGEDQERSGVIGRLVPRGPRLRAVGHPMIRRGRAVPPASSRRRRRRWPGVSARLCLRPARRTPGHCRVATQTKTGSYATQARCSAQPCSSSECPSHRAYAASSPGSMPCSRKEARSLSSSAFT